jgi:hypothetical protein
MFKAFVSATKNGKWHNEFVIVWKGGVMSCFCVCGRIGYLRKLKKKILCHRRDSVSCFRINE